MSEWWTYRLSDFLMFSPRIYWRLIELYNRDIWPAQLLGLSVGVAAIWLATRRSFRASRALALLLAAAWLWVGWAFFWQRYAGINWSARYVAMAWLVQAIFLLAWAVAAGRIHIPRAGDSTRLRLGAEGIGWRVGAVLAVAGVLLYPLAGLPFARPWTQAEVFGVAAEPTALATLGVLWLAGPLLSRGARWLLAVIPALSLLLGAATLWAMAG